MPCRALSSPAGCSICFKPAVNVWCLHSENTWARNQRQELEVAPLLQLSTPLNRTFVSTSMIVGLTGLGVDFWEECSYQGTQPWLWWIGGWACPWPFWDSLCQWVNRKRRGSLSWLPKGNWVAAMQQGWENDVLNPGDSSGHFLGLSFQ